jgi:hypothetical protein
MGRCGAQVASQQSLILHSGVFKNTLVLSCQQDAEIPEIDKEKRVFGLIFLALLASL